MAFAGKVLILVENLSVPFDRRVWQESLALARAGYQVSVICPQMVDKKAFEIIDGVLIYRYPMPYTANRAIGYLWEYSWAMLWTFVYSCYVYFRRGFEIIHACNPPDLFFIVSLPFKIFGVKFLFDQHDLSPETFESKFPARGGILLKILRKLEFWTYKTANVVLSTNESYRKIALERGKLSDNQVFVVRSSPDLKRFAPLPANPDYRRKRSYLAAYLGTMGAQDGLDYLLRSIHIITQKWKRTDIHFLLMGGGENLQVLKDLALSLGITDFVEFAGRVSNETVREVLSSADVCVAPDPINPLNTHCTMNKILEYMAMGKPIVSFRLTESEFSARQAAVYAIDNDEEDFARKIVDLLDNPVMRKEMGEFGSRRLKEDLSWEKSTTQLLRAYEFALGCKKR